MRTFFDTNVLVYAFDCDELERRKKALSLLEREAARGRALLSTQVLEEFYVAVTRKLKRPLGEEAAEQAVRHLARLAVVAIDPQLVFKGIVRSRVSRVSFWDSLIIESAIEGKAEVLYTEDMQHGQELDGIRYSQPLRQRIGNRHSKFNARARFLVP